MEIRAQVCLEWEVSTGGYEFADAESNDDLKRMEAYYDINAPDPWLKILKPIGWHTAKMRPLDLNPLLYKHFAELPYSPRAYQKFAARFGQLEYGSRLVEWAAFQTIVRELLNLPNRQPRFIAPFREYMEGAQPFMITEEENEREPWLGPLPYLRHLVQRGSYYVQFVNDDRGGPPILKIDVHDLRAGIALQALRCISATTTRFGLQTLQCLKCGKYFEVGTGTKRRSTARYCTPRCREEHRYLRKKLK
jgi:hypothetical protein